MKFLGKTKKRSVNQRTRCGQRNYLTWRYLFSQQLKFDNLNLKLNF